MGIVPPMPMPNYNPPGNYLPGAAGQRGFMPQPIGGYWNQMAQQMAGPMYLPPVPPAGTPYPIRPPAAATPPIATPYQPPSGQTMPGLPASVGGIPLSHGGRVLARGGGAGGGAMAGMGVRSYGGNYTMHGVAQLPNDPVYGIDGAPNSVIPSPFGGGGGGSAPVFIGSPLWQRPPTQVA